MASKTALMAVALLVLVAGDLVHGHTILPPLGRARRSLGWMQGMKGGPPSGHAAIRDCCFCCPPPHHFLGAKRRGKQPGRRRGGTQVHRACARVQAPTPSSKRCLKRSHHRVSMPRHGPSLGLSMNKGAGVFKDALYILFNK
ncbi:hypothetical protein VPH35_106858 [Triticum aestivum]